MKQVTVTVNKHNNRAFVIQMLSCTMTTTLVTPLKHNNNKKNIYIYKKTVECNAVFS